MKVKVLLCSLIYVLVFDVASYPQGGSKAAKKKTVIEGEVSANYYSKLPPNISQHLKDSIELNWFVYDYVTILSAPNTVELPGEKGVIKGKVRNGIIKWIIYTDKPLQLVSSFFDYTKLISPGDSIHIRYDDSKPVYSGIGAVSFKMQSELLAIKRRKRPKEPSLDILQNYFANLKWYDGQLKDIVDLIESYKGRISDIVYQTTKIIEVKIVEEARVEAFSTLYEYSYDKYGRSSGRTVPVRGLTLQDLGVIWDTTQRSTYWGTWLRSQAVHNTSPSYLYSYNRDVVRRRFSFDFSVDTMFNDKLRKLAYYNNAKVMFSGQLRERLMTRLLAEELITELSPGDDLTNQLYKEYLKTPGYYNFKKWIKAYYTNSAEIAKSNFYPKFSLWDQNGDPFTTNEIKNKVVLLDFWFTGCQGCVQMVPGLKKVEETFKHDDNVQFLSISIDKDSNVWMKSVNEGKYTTGTGTNLYTGGTGEGHHIIEDFGISGYPALFIIDDDGKLIRQQLPDPRSEVGYRALVSLIEGLSKRAAINQYSKKHDGPYVSYADQDSIVVTRIEVTGNKAKAYSNRYSPFKKDSISIAVLDSLPSESFNIRLKQNLVKEPSTFAPAKQFVISDIEGNFYAFSKLLQANNVIDKNYNWTFGQGHLICNGDFLDRGTQVTECLWLIYHMEQKAKAAGGYVHFILGNHEIMNMSGDTRYVSRKYSESVGVMGISLLDLYNNTTELGRWLRTKNIIEKVGDVLYVHGGISPVVNRLPIDIEAINELARSGYGTAIDSSNGQLRILFNSEPSHDERSQSSPFWFRGYFNKKASYISSVPTPDQVDSTLRKFDVRLIVTGHTIVSDTVSAHYNGRIINVDTHHADGYSEALLIDGNRYYRATTDGRKILLMYKKQENYPYDEVKFGTQ